jgi:8-oxo-dGTP diphosphatase
MSARSVQKVFAYVTRMDPPALLVFRQPVSPEVGIQVPAGTLEEGEDPAAGVLREVREETGLAALVLRRFLGTARYDMKEFGRAEIQVRHFFHLECQQSTPERWSHEETGGGIHAPIEFELFWAPLPDGVPPLIGGHGAMLQQLMAAPLDRSS